MIPPTMLIRLTTNQHLHSLAQLSSAHASPSFFSLNASSLPSLSSALAPPSAPTPSPSLWTLNSGFPASNFSLIFPLISSKLGTTHFALSHGLTPMRYIVSISSIVRPWPSMTKK